MKILRTISELRAYRQYIHKDVEIGFVPTMGALHAGHASLLKRAREENDLVILSIFINPTQFNDASDLEKYPKTTAQDLALAQEFEVDAVFMPEKSADMYPDGYRYQVIEKDFSKVLCGEFRPGHFDGMLTVVLKLLLLTKATRAYFGEKDYQQLKLVQDLTHSFFIDTQIIACPTVREADGLAMSSRNLRLTHEERTKAPLLYQTIKTAQTSEEAKTSLESFGFRVEYIQDLEHRRYAAAWLGNVRLIDNVER